MVSRVIAAIKAPKLSTYTGYYSCYLYTTTTGRSRVARGMIYRPVIVRTNGVLLNPIRREVTLDFYVLPRCARLQRRNLALRWLGVIAPAGNCVKSALLVQRNKAPKLSIYTGYYSCYLYTK